jgi:two-component system, chemotaxis family, protein-glutamate methylesterase/glutaminase
MNAPGPNPGISVLIADDSAFMRAALSRMVESDPGLYVCATAQRGLEALEQIVALRPDVVTLDVEMPGLNGLETLKRIMKECPVPVIMVSSLTQQGAETTLDALNFGAFDYLSKQNSLLSADTSKIRDDLVSKIYAAAESRKRRPMGRVPASELPPVLSAHKRSHFAVPGVIVLGTSTGGPKALQEILPTLPSDLPVAILVVQHMPRGFTKPLAVRLNGLCRIKIREAEHDDPVEPGCVYIAPAGQHMTIYRSSLSKINIRLSTFPEKTTHTPSVDVTMLSVAEVFQNLAMGVIMTGMGSDGAQGMRAIYQAGGLTLGQDEASCAVYGMPRACAEQGVVHRVVTLRNIPDQILQAIRYWKRA